MNPNYDEVEAYNDGLKKAEKHLKANLKEIRSAIKLEAAKARLKKARKSVSGVVAADMIAEEIKAKKVTNVTPKKGKKLVAKYNKQKSMEME